MSGKTVVPEEALEAAAEAIASYRFADWPAQAYEGEAHAALEAAAPFIAAKALDDAADAIEPLWFVYHGGRLDQNESRRNSLRIRAAAVRGEG